jgi:DNA (cytosine-5)-methyltransferase 1
MKVASYFSGCGGMDLGFIQAGHEIVFACDFDKYCKQTYDANFSIPLTLLDFNTIKPEDIPEADIYIGGPPCFTDGTLILTKL